MRSVVAHGGGRGREVVDSGCIAGPKPRLLGGAELAFSPLASKVTDYSVISREGADGPVGAEEDTVWTERIQYLVEAACHVVALNSPKRTALPIGLCHQARQLAHHVR